jgi:hypothetical protein
MKTGRFCVDLPGFFVDPTTWFDPMISIPSASDQPKGEMLENCLTHSSKICLSVLRDVYRVSRSRAVIDAAQDGPTTRAFAFGAAPGHSRFAFVSASPSAAA